MGLIIIQSDNRVIDSGPVEFIPGAASRRWSEEILDRTNPGHLFKWFSVGFEVLMGWGWLKSLWEWNYWLRVSYRQVVNMEAESPNLTLWWRIYRGHYWGVETHFRGREIISVMDMWEEELRIFCVYQPARRTNASKYRFWSNCDYDKCCPSNKWVSRKLKLFLNVYFYPAPRWSKLQVPP